MGWHNVVSRVLEVVSHRVDALYWAVGRGDFVKAFHVGLYDLVAHFFREGGCGDSSGDGALLPYGAYVRKFLMLPFSRLRKVM